MKDPKPLLREGASDFERQLLGAVMRERPSPQLRSRMRQTIGLTGPIAWASSVKAMLSALAGKGAVSVAVVGLVAAGVVGVRSLQSENDAPSAVRETAPVATLAPAVSPPPPVAAPAMSAPAVSAPAVSAPAIEEQSAAPGQAVGNRELREEILLLDQVRAALQSGSGAAALEQLDAYRQRFPSGILSREAAQLRQQAGSAARAHSKAQSSSVRSH
jgi:hypothetical protein